MVQGIVDQSASRKRLKCQGVFMCTPLWRGTMAYRFLAFALVFNTVVCSVLGGLLLGLQGSTRNWNILEVSLATFILETFRPME